MEMFQMMMNPIEILKNFMRSGGTPQEFVSKYMRLNNVDPNMSRMIQMVQTGNIEEVKNIARNHFKENGRDFDKEFSEFIGNFR